ncbi:MAG: DNA gyrase subunit A [Nitrospinae bacterium]|nr:DNA gyrase subunit A [Nitrospinota bacterium]
MDEKNDEVVKEEYIPVCIDDDMKNSYIDYAMSVIIGRALPDVRDGLKPVHRRILYAMYELGNAHNKPYKKSARIVGDVIGKYHPHGDTAVYDAIVRMAQTFSLRYPLIDGQGNFGSIDGDSAAAMRYTEIRMSKMCEEFLNDLDKETVDISPNYDDSLTEPSVMPSKIPNLIINGVAGIAVGMATNIPPHNQTEVIDGIVALMDDENLTILQLMDYVKGPDFPTGAIINGVSGIYNAYQTGKGSFHIRAKCHIEQDKEREIIIVDEIPFQVNKAKLVEKIAHLVRDKIIGGISELRDESDKEGIRVVIELKRGISGDLILNQLYKHTQLQDSFSINFIAIVNNKPRLLNLKEYLNCFIDFRLEVVTRRTIYLLKKAREKAHILRGLKIALDNIDEVVKLIKESKSTKEAEENLKETFGLDTIQAKAILDMRLARLTALERDKIEEDLAEEERKIEEYVSILKSEDKKKGIIKNELAEIKEKYHSPRKTEINEDEINQTNEDLIPDEPMVVTVTNRGYIKRMPVNLYRSQRRGGKGVIMGMKDEDFIVDLMVGSNHQRMFFFTNTGRVFMKKVWQIPQTSRIASGMALVNLLNLKEGENIQSIVPIPKDVEGSSFVFCTEKGMIKKVTSDQFESINVAGKIAIILREEDQLADVKLLKDDSQFIFVASKGGKALRFKGAALRPMGRNSIGVSTMKLKEDDKVIGMIVAEEDKIVLTITELGYGKRSEVCEYREVNRRGTGVINVKITEKNGPVVSVKLVEETDEFIILTRKGKILRSKVETISVLSRNTQGVRVMKLDEGDLVLNIATIKEEFQEKEEETEGTEETDATATTNVETTETVAEETKEEKDNGEE